MKQTATEFLRSLSMHAAVTDAEYLRFDVADRDRLCRLAELGEDFWPELSWAPRHSQLMALLKRAGEVQAAKRVAHVAEVLTK